MFSRITTLCSCILAGAVASYIINFLRLDWQKGQTRGFFAGLAFSLMWVNTTIFAVLFNTGIKFRPSGGDDMSADAVIAAWPSSFITLPSFTVIFTLSCWILDILIGDNRHR